MFKKTTFAVLAAAVSLTAAPAFAASPVAGTWATAVVFGEQKFESTMTVAEGAGGVSVDIKDAPMPGAPPEAAAMPSKISDVAVDGSKLTFKRHLTTPQGEMDLAYAVTAEGDKLSGSVTTQFGEMAVTGTRQ
jgi:hypothetical protein